MARVSYQIFSGIEAERKFSQDVKDADLMIADVPQVSYLYEIMAYQKNCGYGSKTMEEFIRIMKKCDVNLIIFYASPLDQTTSIDKLIKFYFKFGAEIDCKHDSDAYIMTIKIDR